MNGSCPAPHIDHSPSIPQSIDQIYDDLFWLQISLKRVRISFCGSYPDGTYHDLVPGVLDTRVCDTLTGLALYDLIEHRRSIVQQLYNNHAIDFPQQMVSVTCCDSNINLQYEPDMNATIFNNLWNPEIWNKESLLRGYRDYYKNHQMFPMHLRRPLTLVLVFAMSHQIQQPTDVAAV